MSSRTHRRNPRPRSTANPRLNPGDKRGLRAPGSGPLALVPGTDGAVLCERCETWVKALPQGQPIAHAYGGYGVRAIQGRPRCEGSGAYVETYEAGPTDGCIPEVQARARRLVTVAQLARKFGLTASQVRYALKRLQPEGRLDSQGVPNLYRVEPALELLRSAELID